MFQIAHISDIHCGGPHFMPSLMERAIGEINDLGPDLVICTGDLTTFGFKQEFSQAKAYLDQLDDRVAALKDEDESRDRVEEEDYRRLSARSLGRRGASRIAVLYASGVIASGSSSQDTVNGAVVGFRSLPQLRPGDILLMHFRPTFVTELRALADRVDEAGLRFALLEDYLVPDSVADSAG